MKIYSKISALILCFALLLGMAACEPNPTPMSNTCYVKKVYWTNKQKDSINAILFIYNTANQLVEQKFTKQGIEKERYTYTYNAQGKVTKCIQKDMETGVGIYKTIDYIYNSNNVLTSVKYSDFFGSTGNQYNAYGNTIFSYNTSGLILEARTKYSNHSDEYWNTFEYDLANNARKMTASNTPNPISYYTDYYTFDTQKNPFKGLPPYCMFFQSYALNYIVTAPITQTSNSNNYASISGSFQPNLTNIINYTYNTQGYPITATSFGITINYEYDCK